MQMPGTATATDTAAVAHELADLCRAGRNLDAIAKFYSPNIVSIEPVGDEQNPAELHGIDAVRGKNEWWYQNYNVNSVDVKGPFMGDHEFAMFYDFDVTGKATGDRTHMAEMALYQVQDGKIVKEQFFYNVPGK
jgi:hypothetical protein